VDGYESAPDEELRVDLVFTTPGYPAALRPPVLAGRDFDSSDGPGGEQVAIVNRSMAERYWPGGAAVGGTVLVGGGSVRVVGVVENTTWNGLADEVTTYVYVPLAQTPSTGASAFLTVATRADAAPDAALGTIRGTLVRAALSGCDMWSEPAGRWPFEDLHAAEHALLAVRTQAESGGQEGEEQFGLFGGSATGVGVDPWAGRAHRDRRRGVGFGFHWRGSRSSGRGRSVSGGRGAGSGARTLEGAA
jgi:hypothetical protein